MRRAVHDDNEITYLLRVLGNTSASRYRNAGRPPAERQLFEDDVLPLGQSASARELIEAIISAPARTGRGDRCGSIGLSYRDAARFLSTREATITTLAFTVSGSTCTRADQRDIC